MSELNQIEYSISRKIQKQSKNRLYCDLAKVFNCDIAQIGDLVIEIHPHQLGKNSNYLRNDRASYND